MGCRDWFFWVLGRVWDTGGTQLEFPHQHGNTNRNWINGIGAARVTWCRCRLTHTALEKGTEPSISSQPRLSAGRADMGTRWQMGKGRRALCRYKQEMCEARVPAPVNFVPVWSSSGCDYLECVRAEERRMGEKLSSCLSHHCCRFALLIYCLCSWGVQREVNES